MEEVSGGGGGGGSVWPPTHWRRQPAQSACGTSGTRVAPFIPDATRRLITLLEGVVAVVVLCCVLDAWTGVTGGRQVRDLHIWGFYIVTILILNLYNYIMSANMVDLDRLLCHSKCNMCHKASYIGLGQLHCKYFY